MRKVCLAPGVVSDLGLGVDIEGPKRHDDEGIDNLFSHCS